MSSCVRAEPDAVGFGTIWGIAAGWCIDVAQQSAWSDWPIESLMVQADGTPLIRSYPRRDYYETTYRTLDGAIVERTGRNWLSPVNLVRARRVPGRAPWSWRILAFSDGQRPATFWYFVHDGFPDGRGYFAGYDKKVKYRVGFIGQSGFRKTLPPESDQFPITAGASNLYMAFARPPSNVHSGSEPAASYYSASVSDDGFLPWTVHFISGRRLLQIDLRAKTVQDVLQADDLFVVRIGQRRVTHEDSQNDDGTRSVRQFLALRLSDRILVLNSGGSERQSFPLPQEFHTAERLDSYSLADDLTLVDAFTHDYGQRTEMHRFRWIDSTGRVIRQKDVVLTTGPPNDPFVQSSLAGLIVPAPALITIGATLLEPLTYLGQGRATSYSGALTRSLSEFWLALLATYGLLVTLAWLCCRRQNRYAARGLWTWGVFVVLFGLPGFFGYLFHRRWPVLETCPRCDALVPRDRNACSICGERFPEPEPTACEIFALRTVVNLTSVL